MINIADFFRSLRLSWIRRYAFGNEQPLDDHWRDLLDRILISVGRALAMKAGDPGSSPGRANNFSGRGYWHTLVIQLLGGPEV